MSKAITTFHSAYAGSMYPDAETDEYGYVRYADHAAVLRERDERIAALEAENARLSAPVTRKELEAILGDARVTGDVTFQMAARQFADEIIAARKGAA